MKYLGLMTLSGSFLYMGYLVWERVFKKFLTENMKYKALKMVLMTYAVPWVWLKRVYGGLPAVFFKEEAAAEGMWVDLAEISTTAEAYRTENYRKLLLVVTIWAVGAAMVMAVLLVRQACKRYFLITATLECEGEMPEKILEDLRTKIGWRGKVRVREAYGGNSPITIGLFRPIIIIPVERGADETELMLRHEMVHIVRRDELAKIFMGLACCLHWFNLLIYFLLIKFNRMCEYSCDECVTCGCSQDECAKYAKLISKYTRKPKQKILFESAMSGDFRTVEERAKRIMKKQKITNIGKIIAAGGFALLLFADSLTALAYPNVEHIEDVSEETAEDAKDGNILWGFDAAVEDQSAPDFEILYDEQFVNEDGKIYSVDAVSPMVICLNHNIESGKFATHNKDENGGCTMKVYNGTRCTKCNTIWVGDLDYTTTYVKCPH